MKKIVIVVILVLICISSVFGIKYYNEKPVFKLIGENKVTIDVNSEYHDDSVEAKAHNKDLINKVKIDNNLDNNKIGVYDIVYTLKYHNKEYTLKRQIEVVDKQIPSITLKGNDITITVGDKYIEPGYSALDNYDGDITDKVKVINDIDTNKPGTYEIKYEVEDTSLNKYSINRKVIVKEKIIEKTIIKDNNKSIVSTKQGTGHGVPILMYHYFYDENNKQDEKINDNYVEIKNFEAQMKYLHDNNYYFPTWQELALYIDGKKDLPLKSVIVTCDDGHKSFFNLAIPILNKYNIKATSFIITSKPSAENIPKYKSNNIIFESHTHNMHRGGCTGGHGGLFRCIQHDKGVQDLRQSIQIVGNSDVLAYPYGDVTENVLSITKEAGFTIGVTTKYGRAKKGMDKLQLPRVRISKSTKLAGFISAL